MSATTWAIIGATAPFVLALLGFYASTIETRTEVKQNTKDIQRLFEAVFPNRREE